MLTNNLLVRVVATATACVGLMFILRNRKQLTTQIKELFYSEKKKKLIDKINQIWLAEKSFREQLTKLETEYFQIIEQRRTVEPSFKIRITELNVDLDFIYSTLDGINGDIDIKKLRKELVDKFESYAHRIDYLLVDLDKHLERKRSISK